MCRGSKFSSEFHIREVVFRVELLAIGTVVAKELTLDSLKYNRS